MLRVPLALVNEVSEDYSHRYTTVSQVSHCISVDRGSHWSGQGHWSTDERTQTAEPASVSQHHHHS